MNLQGGSHWRKIANDAVNGSACGPDNLSALQCPHSRRESAITRACSAVIDERSVARWYFHATNTG
jgi:hypothetical protein